MAWFKFGKQDASLAKDAPVETVETLRSRAKRRLIGALVLVLAAVIGFPLLFDTQPRPSLVDMPIEIPDKNKVKPLTPPPPLAPAVATAPAPSAKVDDKASLASKEEIVSTPPAPTVKEKNTEKPPLAPVNTTSSATKSVANAAASDKAAADKAAAEKAALAKAASEKAAAEKAEKAANKAAADKAAAEKSKAEAAKAKALLEGQAAPTTSSPAASAAEGARYIVQFGSFAEADKAREVRQKVEKAGLKTYAQIAETSEGKRHRVRVGPFPTRAEADKAAAKIKALDLPASILTL